MHVHANTHTYTVRERDFQSVLCFSFQLYFSIKDLLKDHLTLLSDFAGFLMPDQAKVCGCLMEHINFKKCREFLRKLEVSPRSL